MLKIAGIFIGLLLFQFSFGQSFALENYTPGNGLVDARVSKMFQDSKGRLFFLTPAGFSIFDGQHFDNYGNDIHQGIGIINDIAEYKDGLVKVFSYDGDVYLVQDQKVQFDSTHRKQLSEISKIYSLSQDEKIILTNYHFLREKEHQFNYLNIAAIKPGFIVTSTQIGNRLILLQANENKSQQIYLYNFQREQIEDSILFEKPITYLNKLEDHILLIKNDNSWIKLDSMALEHGKLAVKTFKIPFNIPAPFENCKAQFLANNICWLIQPNLGYLRIKLKENTKEYFPITAGLLNAPHWVFEDAEKNYWFGSAGSGVQKLQRSPLVKLNQLSKHDLGNVKTLNQGNDQTSFILATGGLFLNEQKVSDFQNDNNYFINWNDQFWQFKGYKTLVSNQGHAYQLDKLIANYQPEDFLFAHSFIDSKGRLVIAGRIFLFIDKDYTFHYYRPAYFCDNLLETGKDEYIGFLRNNEVIKLHFNQKEIQKTYTQLIPNLSPRYTLQWDSVTFLCGTRLEGIRIFKWEGNQFIAKAAINRSNGLSNNFVNVLLKKDQKTIVAGTSAGLDRIRINEQDTTIDNLSLLNNIFLPFVDVVESVDNSLLTRTLDGQLFRISNLENKESGFNPVCYFKNILVNDVSIDIFNEKEFNYSSNNFFFSVSSPSFLENKRIKFIFLLTKDGEIKWQQNSNVPDFEIKNLAPGAYSLQVMVKYPSQKYADKKLAYSFVINPPFWKRWWFTFLSVVLLVSTISLIAYWIYRRQLRAQINKLDRARAIEKERTRIALDMHDDFGSNLSRIKFISEKIQLHHKQDAALVHDLSKISFFSDEMIEKLNEIVWALNLRYDSLDDLIGYCRSYVADYLQDKNIELMFDAPSHINSKISGEIRRNIFVVIKESIHNVVKHSGANQVQIKFTLADQLEINIKDNGKGIDVNNIRAFANGISNMKERIETVGGSFEISNNQGTEIKIVIPV
jgi:signal transduction histidine kinase/ligand-binding sensor domain-containing protein